MGTQYDKSQNNQFVDKPVTENTLKDLATQLEGVTVDPETRHKETKTMKFGVGNNRSKNKPEMIPKKLKSILRNKKGKSILTKQRKCVRFCEQLLQAKKDKKVNMEASAPKSDNMATQNESAEIHN